MRLCLRTLWEEGGREEKEEEEECFWVLYTCVCVSVVRNKRGRERARAPEKKLICEGKERRRREEKKLDDDGQKERAKEGRGERDIVFWFLGPRIGESQSVENKKDTERELGRKRRGRCANDRVKKTTIFNPKKKKKQRASGACKRVVGGLPT